MFSTSVLLVCGSWSYGDVMLAEHDWDIGTHNWSAEFGDATLDRQSSGGNPNGWLQITFDETSADEVDEIEWYDVIHVNSPGLFAGDWTQDSWIEFDFWASNETPNDIQLQFHSTNDNVWGYNFTSRIQNTQTWSTVRLSLNYAANWGGLPGFDDTLDQYLSDLSSVDWIGLYTWREESATEIYGLDNFKLMVPEPAECIMLAAALATSAMSLGNRRKKKPRGKARKNSDQ